MLNGGYPSFESIKFRLFTDQVAAQFLNLSLLRRRRVWLGRHPQFLLIGSQVNVTQTSRLDLLPQVPTTTVNVGRRRFWHYSRRGWIPRTESLEINRRGLYRPDAPAVTQLLVLKHYQMVGWSLTSLISTNMAISKMSVIRWTTNYKSWYGLNM